MQMARTIESLEALQLGHLPDSWIDAIWAADFVDVDSTWPEKYQEVLENEGSLVAALTMTVNSMTPWTSNKAEKPYQSKVIKYTVGNFSCGGVAQNSGQFSVNVRSLYED
jgi:hypothetical protein